MHFRIDLEPALATFPALFSVLLDSLVFILFFNLIYLGISFSTLLCAHSVSLAHLFHTLYSNFYAQLQNTHQFISSFRIP